jgi:methylenetetrahydrofolate dehydrogenase (NADP+)/methenyltetrahydrofolate cyclohydrolase
MKIIDGKKLQKEILTKVKNGVASLPFVPVFCDILVGDNLVSAQYVRMKAKMAESLGIKFQNASFPISISTEELIKEIKILNKIQNMCGIIIQLPLPDSLNQRAALDAIDPSLDVDCLGSVAGEEFYSGKKGLGFPTALACIALLDSLNLDLQGKKIAVIGQGELVGKPVTALLRFRGLKVQTADKYTDNNEKAKIIKEADVIISGTGRGKLIKGDMIKNNVVLIDAGTSEAGNGPPGIRTSIVGDIDLESVKNLASYVSPVPGGVGPVTVAMLLQNVLQVAQKIK